MLAMMDDGFVVIFVQARPTASIVHLALNGALSWKEKLS
jgi:hypothetical protein